jgi:hypothetical protein
MLKCTVAIAALMLGAPVAFAQGAHTMDRGGGAAGMSDSGHSSSGPSSGGASHERSGGASSGASEGTSGSSASDLAPGHEKQSGSAKENAPGHMKSDRSAREYAPGHRKDSSDKMNRRSENKSQDLDRNSKNRDRADRGEKSSHRNAKNDRDNDRSNRNASNERDRKDQNARNDRDHNKNQARAHERGSASTGASEGTEGRSGGRGSITNVTTEQKTRIRSVFTQHHVEPARNLNVAVNVGVRLPHSVHLYPVPQDVVEIVPEYRDYDYILLDDNRVAIIDPDTFEVVDIIILA